MRPPSPSTALPLGAPIPAHSATQAWTIYAVDLRFGRRPTARLQRDVPRLTPLPSPEIDQLLREELSIVGSDQVFEDALRALVALA